VVMPAGTPAIKYQAVERLGASVLLFGADLQEAKVECLRIAEKENYVFVPPFDDPLVIAGQGTVGERKFITKTIMILMRKIGLEILRQLDADSIEAIFVPIGGGGLISGVAAYTKSTYPNIKVVGVNCVDSDAMKQAMIADRPVLLPSVNGFSDGTAVREVGAHCYNIAKHAVDEIILVTTVKLIIAENLSQKSDLHRMKYVPL
jgi:threonine dehydratase